MATLEELAASLLGGETQAAIAAENPYYRLQTAPRQVGDYAINLVASDPTRYGSRDAAIAGGITGLISGLLGGIGDEYQQTLSDRYMNRASSKARGVVAPEEFLPTALVSRADRTGDLFRLTDAIQQRQIRDKSYLDTKEKVLSKVMDAQTPRQRAQALETAQALGFVPAAVAAEVPGEPTKATEPTVPEAPRGIEQQILDEVASEANRLMDQGALPSQAFTTAREAYESKRKELDRQYERVEEAEKAGADLSVLTGQLREAVGRAGNTGWGGEAAQSLLAGPLSLVNESQAKKYAGGEDVKTFANEAVKSFGRAFKGPMSDRDVQIMLKAAPSLSNPEEVNQNILDRWDFVANLQKMYADFMKEKRSEGVPVSQAESEWAKLRKEYPYVIKTGAGYEINPAWRGGASPDISGGRVQTKTVNGVTYVKVQGGWKRQ